MTRRSNALNKILDPAAATQLNKFGTRDTTVGVITNLGKQNLERDTEVQTDLFYETPATPVRSNNWRGPPGDN